MLKILEAPAEPILAQKSFSVSGTADASDAGKTVFLTIDRQVKLTGPVITSAGTWQIEIAFLQPGNHNLEITLDGDKVELPIRVIAEVLVGFYLGQQPDSEGRTIQEIWSWNYQKLENKHDYIQWLFPLQERSRYNRKAPILNDEIIQEFRTNSILKTHLLKSLKVMLGFYGLQCLESESKNIEITQSHNYGERKQEWINPGNHNYLRLTRILTCLKLLGLDNYAKALFDCLEKIYEEESKRIGSETFNYWRNAIR
ncbi:opioid growth factor receptor-related protein [Microcoleus sp. FACHB-672]|uniref:opioid growth factor receptor-related protein n=1 Tax=Microcoleus sp. FACHB-672 TaxID=2692825 RepID=UPI0016872A63|nr:opioid growth factor receptor-related protein [Microcoleus sp. FACHB-672]MBD2043343.1 hypothetical protein [Microcoleus sp. FACHB-672]